MRIGYKDVPGFLLFLLFGVASAVVGAQTYPSSPGSSSSSSHPTQNRRRMARTDFSIDEGLVKDGVYRNQALGFTCRVPAGWVLRTEDMNAPAENDSSDAGKADPQKESSVPEKAVEKDPGKTGGRVLLAAFSRPPEAAGGDVNSSILLAAESVAAYPGLKEAAQYFGPVTEVAKGQGFAVANEPYEFSVGEKTLAREDFQKNLGARVMRQSMLVMLAHGYAVSFTFIAGTEEDVEDLISGLSFTLTRSTAR